MMLKWACFISYRVGKGALASGIVKDFYEKLSNEVELQSEGGVYLSEANLNPGDVLDPALETELCRSACMVVLFTATYFSRTHPYCTREYLAMRNLETKRLGKLGLSVSKQHGLIIPVVLRNLDQMPAEMTKRVWSDLQEFQEAESGIARPKSYFDEIRKLGSYIAARYRELSALSSDEDPCHEFEFPDEQTVLAFLSDVMEAQKAKASS